MYNLLLIKCKFDIQSYKYIQKYFKDSVNGDIYRAKNNDKSDYSYYLRMIYGLNPPTKVKRQIPEVTSGIFMSQHFTEKRKQYLRKYIKCYKHITDVLCYLYQEKKPNKIHFGSLKLLFGNIPHPKLWTFQSIFLYYCMARNNNLILMKELLHRIEDYCPDYIYDLKGYSILYGNKLLAKYLDMRERDTYTIQRTI